MKEVYERQSIICDCGKETANERLIVQFYSPLGIFSRVPERVEFCPYCIAIIKRN